MERRREGREGREADRKKGGMKGERTKRWDKGRQECEKENKEREKEEEGKDEGSKRA